jgi:hypothetical protein
MLDALAEPVIPREQKMKRAFFGVVVALLVVAVAPASAATIFSDNFNTQTPGLNATPSNWTVSAGTVDIIGTGPNGALFDKLPGNGYYIDSTAAPAPPED